MVLFFFPFLPVLHSLLPVGLFTTGHSLLLTQSLVTGFVTGSFGLHGFDRLIVKNLYGATFHGVLQFFLAKGFARLIKVRDIELIIHSQFMAD